MRLTTSFLLLFAGLCASGNASAWHMHPTQAEAYAHCVETVNIHFEARADPKIGAIRYRCQLYGPRAYIGALLLRGCYECPLHWSVGYGGCEWRQPEAGQNDPTSQLGECNESCLQSVGND